MSDVDNSAVLSDQEINLDRYAEVLAHTIHFRTAPSSEVRARLRVPEKRWNEAHAKWTRILVEEAAEDDAPTARQFGTAFAVARTRLREERPTLESLGQLPVEEGMQGFTSLDETQMGATVPTAPVLPFDRRAAARTVAPGNALAQPTRPQESRLRAPASEGPDATMELRCLPALPPSAALPFSWAARPAPGAREVFPVERYASLCVELSMHPCHRATTLRRYQLTEEQWRAIEVDWQARCAREPPARMAWKQACAAYKDWLLRVNR